MGKRKIGTRADGTQWVHSGTSKGLDGSLPSQKTLDGIADKPALPTQQLEQTTAQTPQGAEVTDMYDKYLEQQEAKQAKETRRGFETWITQKAGGAVPSPGVWDDAVAYATTEEGTQRINKLLDSSSTPETVRDSLLILQVEAAQYGNQTRNARRTAALQAAERLASATGVSATAHVEESELGEGSYIADYAIVKHSTVNGGTVTGNGMVIGSEIDEKTVVGNDAAVGNVTVRNSVFSGKSIAMGECAYDYASECNEPETPEVRRTRIMRMVDSRPGNTAQQYTVIEGCTFEDEATLQNLSSSATWRGVRIRTRAINSSFSGSSHVTSCDLNDVGVYDSANLDLVKAKSSTFGGDADCRECTVEFGRMKGNAVAVSSKIFESDLKDNAEVRSRSVVKCSVLEGSVIVQTSNVEGVVLKQGYVDRGDIRGRHDIQTAVAPDGTVWTRYRTKVGFLGEMVSATGGFLESKGARRWGYTKQIYNPEANSWRRTVVKGGFPRPGSLGQNRLPDGCPEGLQWKNPENRNLHDRTSW